MLAKKKKVNKKKVDKKNVISIVSIIVVLLGVVGWICYINATNYVATIKGEKITVDEFKFFLGSTMVEMEQNANVDRTSESALKAFWDTKIEGMDAREYAKQQALNSAKEYKIQLIKAKEKGLKLSKNEIEETKAILNQIKQEMAANYGSDAKGEEAFRKDYNIGYDRYEKILRNLRLIYKYVEQELPTFDVTDTEMEEYYKESPNTVDKVKVRRIMFTTMNLNTQKEYTVQEKEEIKEKAKKVLERIKAGEDSEKLALEYSDDPSLQDNKGLFEVTAQTTSTIPGYVEWVLDHKPGDADLLESEVGYFVVKVESRTTYDEVKDAVKEAVQTKKYLERLEKWANDSEFNVIKNDNIYNKIYIK
ncbi:MAG TPA: peptidylprolyl isomerase [Acetivibrio clariflavus]|nr:peptidylprolyl isomerase [Acetivibrio clariflavus]